MTSSESKHSRRALLRWGSWFAVINGGLAALIGLRYLFFIEFPDDWLARLYLPVAFVGHFAFVTYVPFLLLVAPLTLLIPRRAVVVSFAVLLASVGLTALVMDTLVFADRRFHLSMFTVVLFEPGTWIFAGVMLAIVLVFESLVARWLTERLAHPRRARPGLRVLLVLGICQIGWHGIHAWADATYYVPVTQFSRYLPAFYGATAKRHLIGLGLVDQDETRRDQIMREIASPAEGHLNYPAAPLRCTVPRALPNILLVLIDGLRADVVDRTITPNLYRVAENGLRFERHYSGGNSTRMGVFSLFYGLPSTYWFSFATLQRGPALVDRMQQSGYEFSLYSSSGFGSPSSMDRTVFASVPGLVTRRDDTGKGAFEENLGITAAWLEFIAQRDHDRPFFGLLFYDPPNNGLPAAAAPTLPPPDAAGLEGASRERLRRLGLYRQAAHWVDGLVGQVLDDLRERELWERTLVIITGDHGYELDDFGLGYFGHASNFGAFQLRTPLIMHWPGRESQVFDHRSSHNDLPATLLGEVFGCANPASDYSSGTNLFERQSWEWLVVGSYYNHAVVEPERVTVVNKRGFIEVLGPDYRPGTDIRMNTQTMRQATEEMSRFYR